ncbi:citrate lyase subunit alpha [Sulfitobacter sp.]|uniref:citrate lyase subunit alpha n=1 Tax=Sulfitobacter sp. TaxID=1903071 RepID=UPI0030030F4A
MSITCRNKRLRALPKNLETPLGPMPASPIAPSSVQAPRLPSTKHDKNLRALSDAFDTFDIKDGSVLSFHHHYRNGDRLMNAVLDVAANRGLKGLTIAPSSLFPVHAPLVTHIQSGVITGVVTDYAKGPVADAMMSGTLQTPPLLQSHGGRARALASGLLSVDVAFIGASLATSDGACTGRGGAVPCGPLGYAQVDAAYARHSVVCAHEIVEHPLPHIDIPAEHIDAVIPFANPGDVGGIASDTTLPAQTPQAQNIGRLVAEVITAAGLLQNGMSLQTGAGGYSLAAVPFIGQALRIANLRGSFLSGGITGAHVALQQEGLFDRIHDVQCFDGAAVASSISNPNHYAMSASEYANPLHSAPIVDQLSVMVLGAVEIDQHFNVNVTIAGDGRLIGGPGGHPDAAQGANLTIVTTGLTGAGYPKLVKDVRCVTTPGTDIDVLVNDHGIAVNPARTDLLAKLTNAGLPIVGFDTLREMAELQAVHTPSPVSPFPRLLIEHREGGLLDWA